MSVFGTSHIGLFSTLTASARIGGIQACSLLQRHGDLWSYLTQQEQQQQQTIGWLLDQSKECTGVAGASVMGMSPQTSATSSARQNYTWSELMKRVCPPHE